MRKLLFTPLVLLALNVCGQAPQQAPVPPPMPPGMQPEFIVPVQAGTESLKNGKDTVKFTEQTINEMKQAMAKPDYTVMLTPRGETGQVNIMETKPTYFLVKEKGTSHGEGSFDYVIIVNQRRPMMPGRMQRPPMPPGAPIPPAQPVAPAK